MRRRLYSKNTEESFSNKSMWGSDTNKYMTNEFAKNIDLKNLDEMFKVR